MSKSKYFEIEQEGTGWIVINLVTGMPVYESGDQGTVKIFSSFDLALECGRTLANRYSSIQRGW